MGGLRFGVDLAPGEFVREGFVHKSSCYRVTTGELIAKSGCLVSRHRDIQSNISSLGELVRVDYCCKTLRFNKTHVMLANSEIGRAHV